MVPRPIKDFADFAYDFDGEEGALDPFNEENVIIDIPIDAKVNSKLKGYPPMKDMVCVVKRRFGEKPTQNGFVREQGTQRRKQLVHRICVTAPSTRSIKP